MADADQLLATYARMVEASMGHSSTTTTSELQDFALQYFSGLQFLGVYPADVTPERTLHRCFYIQNTSAATLPGVHWLALARQPGHNDLLFDSFARPPTADWLPHLRGMDLTDDDLNQRYDTKRCGQICVAFGFVFMHHGRDVAALC